MIEILVVLAITALLSGLAIVYTHAGQDQISLSIEESKIAELILEAKDLSVATYAANVKTCAYGVHFNYASSTYSLFEYNTAQPVSGGGREICPSLASTTAAGAVSAGSMKIYANGSWNVHVAQGVVLHDGGAASDTIQDILFYPPDPYTLVNISNNTFLGSFTTPAAPTAYIYLSTADGSAVRTIGVNSAGQVSL